MVRTSCLLLFFMAWSAAAQTDTLRVEELAPPARGQVVVDLSGTLKPETIQEVNRIAAELTEREQGRLVIVIVPRFRGELNGPASELYEAWDVGGVRDDGAVIFLPLGANQAGLALGGALHELTSRRGPLDAFERQIARTPEDRDGAVLGGAREMAALMAEAAPQRKPRPPATSPFAAFRRTRTGLADPDRLLTAELASKTRARSDEIGWAVFVVYDQSRHPVEARALAEHLNTDWKIDGDFWLVVVSTHPADAWILPTHRFGKSGGHRAGIPVAVEEWKQAAEELGREPAGPKAQEAWNSALSTLTSLAGLSELEVPSQAPRDELPDLLLAALKPLVLGVFLLLAGIWIWRREEKDGPDSLPWFLTTGLGWTLVFGLSCAWVRGSFPVTAIFMTFGGSVLVFGGVRSLAAYFWFRPEWYRASACALAALGMLWTMMFFSSRLLEVGVMTRSIDVRELPGTHGGAFLLQGAWLKEEFSAVSTRSILGRDQKGRSTGSSQQSQQLAPLVFEGWTPEQPVPAWLVCQYDDPTADEECAWDVITRNATAPVGLGAVEQGQLIAEAERITALRSVPGARLLRGSHDAASEVRAALVKGLLLPLAFLAAFVAAAVYGWRWDDPTGDMRR